MLEKIIVGLIVALAAAWLVRRNLKKGGGCGCCASDAGCCSSSGTGRASSGCSCSGGPASIGDMRQGGGCGCSRDL